MHGFRMFVSSSRLVFSLTPADVPARRSMLTVLEGLRCLSRLSASAWETLGPANRGHDHCHEQMMSTSAQMEQAVEEHDVTAKEFTVQD
ncbi:MAG: hypothetical protein ACK56F_12375, partial [bacterium]